MKIANLDLNSTIRQCLKGDEQSQRLLYESFYGFGMNIVLRFAGNRQEAEEIFNDGFLKVFNNLRKYNSRLPFKAWLRKVLVNAAIDYYRKFQKDKVLVYPDVFPDIAAVENQVPGISPKDDILPILQKLPPAYRLVFNLYVMEAYKHHEIAKMLGISVGTSKSNLARAKSKLKTLWLAEQATNKKMEKNG